LAFVVVSYFAFWVLLVAACLILAIFPHIKRATVEVFQARYAPYLFKISHIDPSVKPVPVVDRAEQVNKE
jgi:hypothetical protein